MIRDISFLDMKSPYKELKFELDEAYNRIMESGWYILGEELEAFEEEYAAYCNVKYCIGVGNGLEALQLILQAYGIGAGDEVIVPANTYIATWLAISYCGAIPIPVEPDNRTFNLDPDKVEMALSPRTKAILPVHLYGQPVDMDPLREIAQRHNILILEDAAQSQGAKYKGQFAGSLSDGAGTSFYPGKNLGAFGDAGAILLNNSEIAKKVYMLRNYGSQKKYFNEVKGHNSRLDPLQAAFLRVKLKYLNEWNTRRKNIADFYNYQLATISDLTLPLSPSWAEPVWHIFALRTDNRDHLQEYLRTKGISTLIHYPVPPHLSQAYQELGYGVGSFPITEKIASTELSLPMGPHLTLEDAAFVTETIKEYFSH